MLARVGAGVRPLCLLTLVLVACTSSDGARSQSRSPRLTQAADRPSSTAQPVARNLGITPTVGGYGAQLQSGATFTVILFVLGKDTGIVDYVGVSCAPTERLSSGPFSVGQGIRVENSVFRATSADVTIEGRFTSPTTVEGTAIARTANAQGCGIPPQGRAWTSRCDLAAKTEPQESSGNIVIGDTSSVSDGGRAYAALTVVAQGRRIVGNRIAPGACS